MEARDVPGLDEHGDEVPAASTESKRHCEEHRIFSPKCHSCRVVRGGGGQDRRTLDDQLRTEANWRRMREISARHGG